MLVDNDGGVEDDDVVEVGISGAHSQSQILSRLRHNNPNHHPPFFRHPQMSLRRSARTPAKRAIEDIPETAPTPTAKRQRPEPKPRPNTTSLQYLLTNPRSKLCKVDISVRSPYTFDVLIALTCYWEGRLHHSDLGFALGGSAKEATATLATILLHRLCAEDRRVSSFNCLKTLR